jgi:hypothetical protein
MTNEMSKLEMALSSGTLDEGQAPCLSLYQPTHRTYPDNEQDPIRFGNLVKQLEESLHKEYSEEEAEHLLKPFHDLAADTAFWNCALDGLAVLSDRTRFHVYRVPRRLPERAVVADSFHIKPLLRVTRATDRYHVLAVNRHGIRLFEGNRDAIAEISPESDVPKSLTDALGAEVTDARLTVSSYGGGGPDAPGMHHRHGGKKDQVDVDTERFFRAVDRAITEHHSSPTGLPLILAALPEHHAMFHDVSHNPALLPESIDVHPDALDDIKELRQRAWAIMEPHYQKRIDDVVEGFGADQSKGLGSDDVEHVGKSVVEGRVSTLLIEEERMIPGHLDEETGKVDRRSLDDPDVDDVLDDIGTLARKMGADVFVIPASRMPAETGLAATYRY